MEQHRRSAGLDGLPADVLRKIVVKLKLREWAKLSGTCRAFRDLQLGQQFDQVFLPHRACTVPGGC